MRFNGAPAGGAFAPDVGAKTTLVLLADVATTDCLEGKARAPYAPAATTDPATILRLCRHTKDASDDMDRRDQDPRARVCVRLCVGPPRSCLGP